MKSASQMPTLFVAHGSPMNAVANNDFSKCLQRLGRELPRPKAIVCVSAHWMLERGHVTSMERPRTIHDFHGFPPELFEIQYPAPGSLDIAKRVQSVVHAEALALDGTDWGFDHGTWSVFRHMFPRADIPIVQLSFNPLKPGEHHLQIGKELRSLREEGVLIVGSGNVVHNLRQIRWQPDALPHPWAQEFEQWIKQKLLTRDMIAVVNDYASFPAGELSNPTPDHYFPLLYALGAASQPEDKVKIEFEGIQNASISMLTVRFGAT